MYRANVDKHQRKKVFQEDDLVMAHLRHTHFPGIHTKLDKQKCSPSHVAMQINDKTYVLPLQENWNISHTFNVVDLFEYHPNGEELNWHNSRASSLL